MNNKFLDNFLFKFLIFPVFITFLISSIYGGQASVSRVNTEITRTGALQTVETLVNLGSRTPDSSAIDLARQYLSKADEQAGYITEVQPFHYQNLQPLASSLTIGVNRLKGNAALGSPIDFVTAPLMPVPGRGERNDFISADVRNSIAVIYRSDISVAAQVDNARLAGAIGLAIVNSDEGNWTISLTRGSTIPVLALSNEQGRQLFHESSVVRQEATLDIQPFLQTTVGHNLIARADKAIFPRLVIGSHAV
ncbi:MAG: PA domain-containing protein [Leptolyngbyaceae cyanobacterium]